MIKELTVRKKPIVTKSFQWDGLETNTSKFPEWSRACLTPMSYRDDYVLQVATLEGPIYAHPNDYIVLGVHGEIWPVKPDIFQKTYEVLS